MTLDERRISTPIFYFNNNSIPACVIEIGDQAVLQYKGEPITTQIISINNELIEGIIINSAFDPDLHQAYIRNKKIKFVEKNVFSINKKTCEAN